MNFLKSFFQKDARYFQIGALSFFLLYGLFFLDWEAELFRYGIIITTCLITQIVCVFFTTKNYQSWKSALISALGLCLLLKVNLFETAAIAAILTISSKFLIRKGNKHIFNPANFGIIVTILLTGDAWVSPGQWGSSFLLVLFIGVAGLMVLWKVGRIDTGLSFFATFFCLQFFQNVIYKGWPMDYLVHEFSNGTILLFTFFMITDPMTTPNAPKARYLWASLAAVLAFVLTNWLYVYAAPIWALLLLAPFTSIFDSLFIHKKFSWT